MTRQLLHPLGPLAGQAVAHGVNFLSQIALWHLTGATVYGEIGLGLLTLATLCFIAELGGNALFIRQVASDSNWPVLWRIACGRRLVAAVLLGLIAAGGCLLWRGAGSVLFLTVVAGLPGVLLSAIALTPVLYGLRQPHRAVAGQYWRWGSYSAGVALSLLLTDQPPLIGLGTGLAVSAGWLVQYLHDRRSPGLPPVLRPMAGRLPPALRRSADGLLAFSLISLLHGRALPFLIAAQAPHLLAACLLMLQILQGLASLFAQSDRLLLPYLLADRAPGTLVRILGGLMQATGVTAALLLLALALWGSLHPGPVIGLGVWLLLEWLLNQWSYAGYVGTLVEGVERRMLTGQLGLLLAGLAAQALLFWQPAEGTWLLAGRAALAGGLAALAWRLLPQVPWRTVGRSALGSAASALALLLITPEAGVALAAGWLLWEGMAGWRQYRR